MPKPPLLVVLSGPSGAGKDAVLATLRERGLAAHFAVTATTRPPRAAEREGRDYHFLSESNFRRMIEEGGLIEHAAVYGRYYGVPKAPLVAAIGRGDDVLVRVDVQGAATIKALVPQAVTIFLLPGSLGELEARLAGRNTEDGAARQRRLETARAELDRMPEFDYAVVNPEGKLDQAIETVQAIIRAERCRVGRGAPVIP